MVNSLQLTYTLGNYGWADILFKQGYKEWGVPVSYLENTLSDLIVSAYNILQGSKEEMFRIDSEGYLSLVLLKKDSLLITVDTEDGAEKTQVFTASIDLHEYCIEVIRVAQLILDTYGLEGYFDMWIMHQFPVDHLNELKDAIQKVY